MTKTTSLAEQVYKSLRKVPSEQHLHVTGETLASEKAQRPLIILISLITSLKCLLLQCDNLDYEKILLSGNETMNYLCKQ